MLTMDCGDHGNLAEMRTAERFAMEVPISVRERGSNQIPATLLQLSDGGCRIAGVRLARCGDNPIWVRIPGLESMAARVRWSDEAVAGVAFEHRLYPAVTRRLAALHSTGGLAPAGDYPDPVACPAPRPNRPAASRREQIVAGYVQPDPGILLDKKPLHGSKSLIGIVRRTTNRVADHRSEARYPPPPEAALSFTIHKRPAQLADISRSGIMALGTVPEAIGAAMEIGFDGFAPMAGTLVWKRADRFGVALAPGAIELGTA